MRLLTRAFHWLAGRLHRCGSCDRYESAIAEYWSRGMHRAVYEATRQHALHLERDHGVANELVAV